MVEFINETQCWKWNWERVWYIYGQQCVFVYTIKKQELIIVRTRGQLLRWDIKILRFCSPDTNFFNFNVKASSWQLGNKISLPLKRYQIDILKRFFIQTATCDLTCLNFSSKRLSSLNASPYKPKHIVSSEICDIMSLQLIANIIVHVSDCYHQFTCHWLLH